MTKLTDSPEQVGQAENLEVTVLNEINEESGGLDDAGAAAKAQEQGYGIAQENGCVISEDMAGTILKTPFAVAAAFLGDHWELTKGEVDLMAPPAARVFSELFGKWAGRYPDAYMLGFSLIVAIAPRAAQTVQERQVAKKIIQTEDDLHLEEEHYAD